MAFNEYEMISSSERSKKKEYYYRKILNIFEKMNLKKIFEKEAENGNFGVVITVSNSVFYKNNDDFEIINDILIIICEKLFESIFKIYTHQLKKSNFVFVWEMSEDERTVITLPKYRIRVYFDGKYIKCKRRNYRIKVNKDQIT
jgi:hypothetical protein